MMHGDAEPGPRRAVDEELEASVEILVSAFHDDPTWCWAFPDPARRPAQLREVWSLLVAGAARYPWTWLNASATATTVWIPPGGTELTDDLEAALEQVYVAELGDDAARVLRMGELFDQAHPHDVPHFYLTLLGTSAAHRGHGHGIALLAENLRVIDETGMPCYLESSNPGNVAVYERFGFGVVGSICPAPDAPEIITMWRAGASGALSRV